MFGEKQANDIFSSRNQSDFDPFTGVPTYEMKYEKKTRAIPLLSGRPFIKDFFPAELHSTLDGTDGFGGAVKGATRKRLILASSMTQEEKDRRIRERLDDVVGDEVEGENEEEEQEEEPEDYDFEDDEEENAGDYDAEQYFDDGDDMGDEDEGGGGGDDY